VSEREHEILKLGKTSLKRNYSEVDKLGPIRNNKTISLHTTIYCSKLGGLYVSAVRNNHHQAAGFGNVKFPFLYIFETRSLTAAISHSQNM